MPTAWGFSELWIGEMATYDAFAFATAAGLATSRIGLSIGPWRWYALR